MENTTNNNDNCRIEMEISNSIQIEFESNYLLFTKARKRLFAVSVY